MNSKIDWWSFLTGAGFSIGSIPVLWPEMTIFSLARIPPIVVDFPIKIIFTMILAFLGGMSGLFAKDVYTHWKRKLKKDD
jgi:hypothetical protein